MKTIHSIITELFEDPFYVGYFELIENNELKVSKVTFGQEPKDEDVYQFKQEKHDRRRLLKQQKKKEKHKGH